MADADLEQFIYSLNFHGDILKRNSEWEGSLTEESAIRIIWDCNHDVICMAVANGRANAINLEAMNEATSTRVMLDYGVYGCKPDVLCVNPGGNHETIEVTCTTGDLRTALDNKIAKYEEGGRPFDYYVVVGVTGQILTNLELGIFRELISTRMVVTWRKLRERYSEGLIREAMASRSKRYHTPLFSDDNLQATIDAEDPPSFYDVALRAEKVKFKDFNEDTIEMKLGRPQIGYIKNSSPIVLEMMEVDNRYEYIGTFELHECIYEPIHSLLDYRMRNDPTHVNKPNLIRKEVNNLCKGIPVTLNKFRTNFKTDPRIHIEGFIGDEYNLLGVRAKADAYNAEGLTPAKKFVRDDFGYLPFGMFCDFWETCYENVEEPQRTGDEKAEEFELLVAKEVYKTKGFVNMQAIRTAVENIISTNHHKVQEEGLNCRVHPVWHGAKNDKQLCMGFIAIARAHMKSQSGLKNPQVLHVYFTEGTEVKGWEWNSYMFKGKAGGKDGIFYVTPNMLNCVFAFNLVDADRMYPLAIGRAIAETMENESDPKIGSVRASEMQEIVKNTLLFMHLGLIKLFCSCSGDEGAYPVLRNIAAYLVGSGYGYKVKVLEHEKMAAKIEDSMMGAKAKFYYHLLKDTFDTDPRFAEADPTMYPGN